MYFSLILATIGRVSDVECLLESLTRQTFRNFQVILVDQNTDGRLDQIVQLYGSSISLLRIYSAPGLSRARNAGLVHATGDVVGFPDDDCLYPPWLLDAVKRTFEEFPYLDGVTGRTAPLQAVFDFKSRPLEYLNAYNVWQKAISYTIFLRKRVVDDVGPFDESLGVGAGTPWGAGEETDYLLRAIRGGFKLARQPGLTVRHPDKDAIVTEDLLRRAFGYASGTGRVLVINKLPLSAIYYSLFRSYAGLGLALLRLDVGRARLGLAKIRGKKYGLRGAPERRKS